MSSEEHRRRVLTEASLSDPVAAIRAMRRQCPERALERASTRKLATPWPHPLLLAAGDHPARLLTAWRGDPFALASRGNYLRTLVGLLATGAVDGLEATPDVIEELLFLDSTVIARGEESFLDGKILIGTVNRSGLSGTVFEMVDVASAFTIDAAQTLRLDGLKWMWRLAPEDPLTAQSQHALHQGLIAAYEAAMPVMLEVDWVERREGRWVSVLDQPGRMVELVGVASAWGPSSLNRQLELPVNEHLAAALAATTLPVCVLPPERRVPGPKVLDDYQCAVELPVTGQLLGRDILLAEDPIELGSLVANMWRQAFAARTRQ